MERNPILVIGATGLLGEPVARRLKSEGYNVRVFTHSPAKARTMFGDGFEIVTGDVEDAASLDRAVQGCAGVHVNLLGIADPDLERRGAAHAAEAAARAGVARLTYLSGATVRKENDWFAGTRAKLGAEAAIRDSGVPYTIFRAASFMENLPRYLRGATANVVGKQPHAWRWVAAADYARMVARAYQTPEAANKTLYVLGPEALTLREALSVYCRIVHPSASVRTMPLWAAQFVATVFGVKDLAAALPYIRYFERVSEDAGSPEGGVLLGAPATTLAHWSEAQLAGRIAA